MNIEYLLSCDHTVRCLKKAGIETVEQLQKLSEKDLLGIRGVGKVISRDVLAAMETYEVHRLFILARLDQETSSYCHHLSEQIIDRPIPGYSLYPHITLATLDVPNVDLFVSRSAVLFEKMNAFPIYFAEAAFYPQIASVSILPEKKGSLMIAFEKATKVQPECLTSYYDAGPKVYLPHLTLVHDGHLCEEELMESRKKIQKLFHPFTGQVTEIDYSLLKAENQFEIVHQVKLGGSDVC